VALTFLYPYIYILHQMQKFILQKCYINMTDIYAFIIICACVTHTLGVCICFCVYTVVIPIVNQVYTGL